MASFDDLQQAFLNNLAKYPDTNALTLANAQRAEGYGLVDPLPGIVAQVAPVAAVGKIAGAGQAAMQALSGVDPGREDNVQLGVVPTAKNRQQWRQDFLRAMGKIEENLRTVKGESLNPEMADGLASFVTRYPRVANTINEMRISEMNKSPAPGQTRPRGYFAEPTTWTDPRIKIYQYDDLKPHDYVEALGHEFTHSIHSARNNPIRYEPSILDEVSVDQRIKPNITDPKALQQHLEYTYLPREIAARQGGSTARASYEAMKASPHDPTKMTLLDMLRNIITPAEK